MEQLEEIQVTAERIYGRPYHMLEEEEKDALATAFGIEKQAIEDQLTLAYSMVEDGQSEMLGNGRTQFANWGGTIGELARNAVAAKKIRETEGRRDELSNKERMGRRAAADVGMYNMQEMMRSMRPDSTQGVAQSSVGGATGAMPATMQGGAPTGAGAFGDGSGQAPIRPGGYGAPQPNVGSSQPAVPVPGDPQGWSDYFDSKLGNPAGRDVAQQEEERKRKQRLARALRTSSNSTGIF